MQLSISASLQSEICQAEPGIMVMLCRDVGLFQIHAEFRTMLNPKPQTHV